MFELKFNVIEQLKKSGYSTYRIRKEKLLSETALQDLRNGKIRTLQTLDILCNLLECQPNTIILHLPEKDDS